MLCPVCQSDNAWKRKTMSIPEPSLLFCSEPCLLSHIKSRAPLGLEDLRRIGVIAAPSIGTGKDHYSLLLRSSFRSRFEVMVAEHVVTLWRIKAQYEPHAIPLGPKRWYIPDFWLPDFGIWLEAKGEWRGGGRKKFVEALNIVGPDRLLLMPDVCRKWLGKTKEDA